MVISEEPNVRRGVNARVSASGTMRDMLRFVVDTCVVVAVLENEDGRHAKGEVDAARELLLMAERNEISLQRASAFDRDWERDSDFDRRSAHFAWLAASPVAGPPASGVFRLGVSTFDGPDVLGGEDHARLDQELLSILGDDGTRKGEAKRSSDRDHLLATVQTGAAGLVTLDVDTLLVHRDRLGRLGVNLLMPSEALELVRSTVVAPHRSTLRAKD